MNGMNYDQVPAELRERVEANVRDILGRVPSGPHLADGLVTEVVDELTNVRSDEQLESWVFTVDRLLRFLPEAERKATMYELVMWLGLVDPS
jgi:hypothetical protein